jgi:hypothetical protein
VYNQKNTRQDQSALSDWLDEVPANKIMGFGGDYLFMEGAYGHSVIARQNVATVLASKVDEGYTRWTRRRSMRGGF